MSLPNVLMWLAAVVAAGWKVSQLIRVPRDTGLRVVTLCLLLVVVALSAQLAVGIPELDRFLPANSAKLVQNVVLVFCFALVIVLLQTAVPSVGPGRWRYADIAVGVASGAGLIAVFAVTDPALRGASYEDAGRDPGLLGFYLIGNLFLGYGTLRAGYLAWTVATHTQSRARLSLRAAAVAVLLCFFGTHLPRVLSTAGRLVFGVDPVPGTAVWTQPMLAIGVVAFFLGLGYPGVRTALVKARLWFEVRRRHRQLRPLWTLLYRQFPHIALFGPRSRLREALGVRNLRLYYYRRVVECRDGLVCLSSYLTEPVRAPGSGAQQARLVRAALIRRAEGSPVIGASVLAAPRAPGAAADTNELLALSRALAENKSTED